MATENTNIPVRPAGGSFMSQLPVGVSVMILAAITGVFAGVGAWILKASISWASDNSLRIVQGTHLIWLVIMLPMCGILLAVCYQHYVVHEELEHGTDQLRLALSEHRYQLRAGLCYQPLLASILTLGFGGSAGAEGPIAYAGAAIGSNVSRLFRMGPGIQLVMVGCGAGAGIAGIFKAPVAGAMFAMEVMKVKVNTLTVMALMLASICGGVTCYALTGFTFDVQFLPHSFFDPRTLGWVSLLGIFCGIYSVYYNRLTAILHRFFGSIPNRWLRAAAGGGILAAAILVFPCLYGEGYGTMTQLINGDTGSFAEGGILSRLHMDSATIILLGTLVLLVKVFATIATNSSGGVAGDFAPTVFAGSFAGLVFAECVNAAFDANLSVGLFCLFGAAGAFAGIIHAPLMAIFLVSEIVGNGYGYILPLTVCSFISYTVVKILTPKSKYAQSDHDDIATLVATPSLEEVENKDATDKTSQGGEVNIH